MVVPVVNVPACRAQQRYFPIHDQNLDRCFPGGRTGNTAVRMAHEVFERFVAPCDRCLDFHTSTRNRTTVYHVRADVSDPAVGELARAFDANLVVAVSGESGSLRAAATAAGTPTPTVETGKAHRFQPLLVEKALTGVESSARTASCRGRRSPGRAGSVWSAARARSRGSAPAPTASSTA